MKLSTDNAVSPYIIIIAKGDGAEEVGAGFCTFVLGIGALTERLGGGTACENGIYI